MTADAEQGPPQPVPPPMRASDAERHATVQLLQDAVTRGQLTPGEGSDRMAQAFAARYQRDLPPLTDDLPRAQSPPPAAPGWRPLASLALLQVRTSVSGARSRHAIALAVGLVVAVLLLVALGAVGLQLFGDQPHHFGAGFPGGH